MSELPAYDLGWIRKERETGFDDGSVPVGTIYAFVKGHQPPPGWEWFEPPEEMRAKVDFLEVQEEPRLVVTCFDDRRAGQECPIPNECEETNRCLVQLLADRGWRVLGEDEC